MRAPLDQMILRTAELDQLVKLKGVNDRLSTVASPVGGSYGKVRSSNTKWHNGWDLYARVGTTCYAITAGEIVSAGSITGYGRTLVLKLSGPEAEAAAKQHGVKDLYALYGHLSSFVITKASVVEGARICLSGADGNAAHTPPHLHFEIRTSPTPVKGSHGSIDPGQLLGFQYLQSRSDDEARVKATYSLK